MRTLVGEWAGDYRLDALLETSARGQVYRAFDRSLDRDVAVEVISPERISSLEQRRDVEHQARTLASCEHRNIARLFDILELPEGSAAEPPGLAIVRELVEGPSLADRWAGGPLPIDEACDVFFQLASALEVVHARGLVHRSLDPATIRFEADGAGGWRLRLLDFALAPESSAAELEMTQAATVADPGRRVGADDATELPIASPERLRGLQADAPSDIWSFGTLFYRAITGRSPFEGEDAAAVQARALTAAPDLSHLPSDLDRRLVELIGRCLRLEPRQRLQHIGDARIVLEELLAETTSAERSESTRDRRSDAFAERSHDATSHSWSLRPLTSRPSGLVNRVLLSFAVAVLCFILGVLARARWAGRSWPGRLPRAADPLHPC